MLDVGCGRGLALLELAETYPESEFVGYELSEEAVAFARQQAAERDLDNVRFEVRDVSDFDIRPPSPTPSTSSPPSMRSTTKRTRAPCSGESPEPFGRTGSI